MNMISHQFAAGLIDYAPVKGSQAFGFATTQLDGAVAAYNMLAKNNVAYLADEVGMGKTYVALGVLGLLRHVNPKARAMIIAPRENIQRKWVKELSNFVRVNWKLEDNRFKSLDGAPVRTPVVCNRLDDLAFAMLRHEDCDPILRMTTFSVAVKDTKRRKRYVRQIRQYAPWLSKQFRGVRDPDEFITRLGFAINGLLPELDLLIIDEAHNLRHGFGPHVSNRNRLLAIALGHNDPGIEPPEWYKPKARRVLMLSATPFECDYADLYQQLDVLGQNRARLACGEGADTLLVRHLLDNELPESQRRAIVRRLMIRRVAYMTIAKEKFSKNMYRREWRQGGYSIHDEPMQMTDDRQRLVVALIQKKVSELLGDERFKNCFQIGMLSSFESFLETFSKRQRSSTLNGQVDDEEPVAAFDLAAQTKDHRERQGVDTSHIEAVAATYRKRFHETLPHPKLDATSDSLADSFETGEKTLVFVRRVATVGELKAKLDRRFDTWLHNRMCGALPGLTQEIDGLFTRYRREQRGRGVNDTIDTGDHDDPDIAADDLRLEAYDDEGGIDTFFAWFFRGTGPSRTLSGAAMQRNRFASASTTYSTFFEDDYVAWLLGHPKDPLRELATELRVEPVTHDRKLRRLAFGRYRKRTRQKEGYPRLYVYEAFQAAALALLSKAGGVRAERAAVILEERFGGWAANEADPPGRFPQPAVGIGLSTVMTELQRKRRAPLRHAIWPDDQEQDQKQNQEQKQEQDQESFRKTFRRREQRRELLSAMCRLGAAYIDLYLTAIGQIGSFEHRKQADIDDAPAALASKFLDRLEEQSKKSSFGAFAELNAAAHTFDTIVAVNFPELHEAPLNELPKMFARTLQHQLPVAGMSGGVNKRVVQQFRMPGFPLILATTDVLQEGEDLHTFCRRVIHYGIAWTPSAVEQRTGRVDRIGSLVRRNLEGCATLPTDNKFIQVYYPHLADTIEVLQVRRVLQRINEFLRLSHQDVKVTRTYGSKLDLNTEALRELTEIPRITGLLTSAFDDTASWLDGQLSPNNIMAPPVGKLESKLARIWTEVSDNLLLENIRKPSRRKYQATGFVRNRALLSRVESGVDDCRKQFFSLFLRSQIAGDETLIRCVSLVGHLDLQDDETLDHLYDLQRELHDVRVCARADAKGNQYQITIEEERLFHLSATQTSEIRQLIERTVVAADVIEQEVLGVDAPISSGGEMER